MKATSKASGSSAYKKRVQFPILMQNRKTAAVVLFTSRSTGMFMHPGRSKLSYDCLGSTYEQEGLIDYDDQDIWDIYDGTIVLKNA